MFATNGSVVMQDTKSLARKLLHCSHPSFMQSHHATSSNSRAGAESGRRVQKTAALDGLRGIAALIVFIFHICFSYAVFHEYGWGVGEQHKLFVQLPIVRLFSQGHAMVCVFFVIGGYVLTIKPMTHLYAGQPVQFLHALVSSFIRRAIRLYAPALIAMFISMCTLYIGLWEYPRQFMNRPDGIVYIRTPDHHILRRDSLPEQLYHFVAQAKALLNLFQYYSVGLVFPYYPEYDPHLWTIPVEFRSGMLLALSLLALCRCKLVARFLLSAGLIVFCIIWDRWELVCFFSGSLLCQIDLMPKASIFTPPSSLYVYFESDRGSEKSTPCLPSYHDTPCSSRNSSVSTVPGAALPPIFIPAEPRLAPKLATFPILVFILGLYLLSAPPLLIDKTPFYAWLAPLIPSTYQDPKRFPYTLGALCLIYSLMRSPFLQRPFESSFAQYLGRISFSLYVVHGPVIHIVSFSVTPWIWNHITGWSNMTCWVTGLTLGSMLTAIVVALVADWFWRLVEMSTISWAAQFEKLCFQRE